MRFVSGKSSGKRAETEVVAIIVLLVKIILFAYSVTQRGANVNMDEITYCAGCDSGHAAVDSAGQLVL